MNAKLEQKLFNDYPTLFYMHFAGFGNHNGWYDLLVELLDGIYNHPIERDIYSVEILEIQQLFGEMHIHYTGGDDVIGLLFDHARSISVKTCEICGNPGKPVATSWIRTLCEEHENEARVD